MNNLKKFLWWFATTNITIIENVDTGVTKKSVRYAPLTITLVFLWVGWGIYMLFHCPLR